ncbi:MAG: helix-turn-helix domain-containing protein [Sphingobium sp.]
MIGIGRTKFYQLINAGEVETIKLGSATLIPTASLAALIERQRSPVISDSKCEAHSAINSRRFPKKSVRR